MAEIVQKITVDTNVYELISTYPDTVEILIEYGIPCASCHFSSYDTIQDSIVEFGLDEEDVADLMTEINEIADAVDKAKSKE